MLKWIINKFWAWRYPEWTRSQVEEYFKQCNGNIWLFQNKLIGDNIKWDSDGLNFSRYTDTFARPEQMLARKFGNCGDFMRLFEEFIKYSGCATKYIQYEMTNDYSPKYHYAMVITMSNGETLLQSNLSLLNEEVLKILSDGYDNVKAIDKWQGGY